MALKYTIEDIKGKESEQSFFSKVETVFEDAVKPPWLYVLVSVAILVFLLLVIIIIFLACYCARIYKRRQLKKIIAQNYAERSSTKKKLGTVDYILSYEYATGKLTTEVLQIHDIKFPGKKQQPSLNEMATFFQVRESVKPELQIRIPYLIFKKSLKNVLC